jgi:hypothetical protein
MTKAKPAELIAYDEALAFARECIRQIRNEGITLMGVTLRWFEQDDALKFWHKQLGTVAVNDPTMMHQLTLYARAGWGLADEVLCELETQYGHFRVDKPVALEAYMTDRRLFGRPERTKSAQPHSHFLRDIAIAVIVAEVCGRFGVKPTKSGKQPCGASITADALCAEQLAIGEATVVKIWTRLSKIAFPNGLRSLMPRPALTRAAD